MQEANYGAVLSQLPVQVFLARASQSGGTLTLHASQGRARDIKSTVANRLAAAGQTADLKVVMHGKGAFRRAHSLEALARSFAAGGDIVYDPTGSIARMEAVLDCATALRQALPGRIDSIHLEPARRTLFVILAATRTKGQALLDETRATMQAIAEAFVAWRRTADTAGLDLAVRVGFEPPAGAELVPVDRRSVVGKGLPRLRKYLARGAWAGAFGLFSAASVAPASAADVTPLPVYTPPPVMSYSEPAVLEPNWTLQGAAGVIDYPGVDDGQFEGGFKGTVPLGHSFGGQLDLKAGTNEYWGVGGHLFWRDPSRGLVGLVAAYETLEGFHRSRFGAEGEAYMNQWTAKGRAGYQESSGSDGFWGQINLDFYVTPNFVIGAGYEHDPNFDAGNARVEWNPGVASLPGLSVFADGRFGDDHSSAMAGLRYYFGRTPLTLIDRDRKADPNFMTTYTSQ